MVQATGGNQSTIEYFCFEYTVSNRDVYLRVCELEHHELDLNAGRFARFSRYRQSCRVEVSQDYQRFPRHQEFHTSIIQWIHEHTSGPWSLWMEVQHVSDYDVEWSFERAADAVMFKLVWS